MKISLFGLGYVGCVSAACFAKAGHQVWGVDINHDKVAMFNAGKSPIVEKDIEEMLVTGRRAGNLQAIVDPFEAVRQTEVSLVCVGTPSNTNGSLSLDGVKAVSQQIGYALGQKIDYHCVVFRSTVLPGTVRNTLIPLLSEASGRRVHEDFDVCFNPEFLREGSSVADFYNPPFSIVGEETIKGGDTIAQLYSTIDAPIERTTYEVAEMVKYACNSFHALKVTFANELGILCKSLHIDSHQVMELFTKDRKLNISSAYLKPGFAFGGSCLPKDLRALLHRARGLDLTLPVLTSVLESNRLHTQKAIEQILATKRKKVGILGLSFKAGTDDMRESPLVSVIEALIGKGCQIKIFDADVLLAQLMGANKEFIEKEIPHISSLLCSRLEDVIRESEVIVLGKVEADYIKALELHLDGQLVFDLVRAVKNGTLPCTHYESICW